jgi:hypothetical protein
MAQLHEAIYTAPTPVLHVVDVAPLFPGDEQQPGVYFCVEVPQNTGAHMLATPPVIVYESRDSGTTWDQVAVIQQMVETGTLGLVELETPPAFAYIRTLDASLPYGWDEGSEMRVSFNKSYAPATATEDQVLDGANRLLVGSEVLQFKTAAVADADTNDYLLTSLLRGRRGTETVVSGLAQTDRVFVIDQNTFHFHALDPSDIGNALQFKAVTPGMDLSSVDAVTHTVQALNVSPFAPANVSGTRDGSNNLTITWDRRTRAPVRLLGPQGRPYFEDTDNYEVDIYDGTPAVVRTIEVTTTSASYTAAQQTADGLTPGNPVSLRVYQMSRMCDRGRAAIETV